MKPAKSPDAAEKAGFRAARAGRFGVPRNRPSAPRASFPRLVRDRPRDAPDPGGPLHAGGRVAGAWTLAGWRFVLPHSRPRSGGSLVRVLRGRRARGHAAAGDAGSRRGDRGRPRRSRSSRTTAAWRSVPPTTRRRQVACRARRSTRRRRRQRARLDRSAARARGPRGRWPAARPWRLARPRGWLAPIGLVTIAISLLVDAPKGLDEGEAAVAYQGAEASLLGGFWVQIGCGVLLVVLAPLLTRLMGSRDGTGERASAGLRPRWGRTPAGEAS